MTKLRSPLSERRNCAQYSVRTVLRFWVARRFQRCDNGSNQTKELQLAAALSWAMIRPSLVNLYVSPRQ